MKTRDLFNRIRNYAIGGVVLIAVIWLIFSSDGAETTQPNTTVIPDQIDWRENQGCDPQISDYCSFRISRIGEVRQVPAIPQNKWACFLKETVGVEMDVQYLYQDGTWSPWLRHPVGKFNNLVTTPGGRTEHPPNSYHQLRFRSADTMNPSRGEFLVVKIQYVPRGTNCYRPWLVERWYK